MAQRRRNSSSDESETVNLKRKYWDFHYDDLEDEGPISSTQRPKIDRNYGQSGAFPGLADEDETFYGPAVNGIDYLRMVRSERKGIPQLLTSDRFHRDDDIKTGGYYQDGAYTAVAKEGVYLESMFGQAQQYYYESLLAHFRLIRATMKCVPPLQKVQALDETIPISFPAQSRPARIKWEQQLLERRPHPVQMVSMDSGSVFQLTALMTRKMTHFFKSDESGYLEAIGAWIWATLGKLPDQGELDGDEIAELRAFARRAIDVSRMLDSSVPSHMESQSDSDYDDNAATGVLRSGSVNVKQEPDRDQSNTDIESIEMRTRKLMILDTIVTVIGEYYGQRDLLNLRTVWT